MYKRTKVFIKLRNVHESMVLKDGGDVGDAAGALPESETTGTCVSDATFPETPPPGPSGSALAPDELGRAVSLVERRACTSPGAVPALVDVAGTECGWWLLAELVSVEPTADGPPRDALVESLARATGRSTESVFETVNTALLPKLLVTELVEHVDSVAAPRGYAATVELRSDADREFVSAVLLLVAGAAELSGEAGDPAAARRVDGALRDSVERFSTVVRRVRESSRGASRACERAPAGQ